MPKLQLQITILAQVTAEYLGDSPFMDFILVLLL